MLCTSSNVNAVHTYIEYIFFANMGTRDWKILSKAKHACLEYFGFYPKYSPKKSVNILPFLPRVLSLFHWRMVRCPRRSFTNNLESYHLHPANNDRVVTPLHTGFSPSVYLYSFLVTSLSPLLHFLHRTLCSLISSPHILFLRCPGKG